MHKSTESQKVNGGVRAPAFSSDRTDPWWMEPFAIFAGLGIFGVYSMWVAFQGNHYEFGPYMSPFYSPMIKLPGYTWSPAFLILWVPLGFRGTCYYFRKLYYRTFFQHPTGCAISEPWPDHYKGETSFPFIIQNIHRYFMILALIFVCFHWHDTVMAFFWDAPTGGKQFGVGVGSLLMLLDVVLLTGYIMGCHSLRHMLGGKKDCFSCDKAPIQYRTWLGATFFNRQHPFFAWTSLGVVGLTDLYVRLCSMGIIHDIRLF